MCSLFRKGWNFFCNVAVPYKFTTLLALQHLRLLNFLHRTMTHQKNVSVGMDIRCPRIPHVLVRVRGLGYDQIFRSSRCRKCGHSFFFLQCSLLHQNGVLMKKSRHLLRHPVNSYKLPTIWVDSSFLLLLANVFLTK